MKMPIKFIAPWLAAAAIGGAVAFAPIASAADTNTHSQVSDTDPLVPVGTDPVIPYRLGYVDSNHDEANTTGGGVDLPF
ncbi:hypothetical protein ACRCUN_29905 [Mycobacterium sp. LTG2003]